MKRELEGSENIVKTAARTVVISILVFVTVLYLIAFLMNKKSQFPSIDLTSEEAVYTITDTDGSTRTYNQNYFSLVHDGESMTCEIAPLKDTRGIQNGTLTFSLYHCYVTVYCGDQLIYQQTEPEKGDLIGHRYYIIPLPEGYENETIRIHAVCSEHDTFSSFDDPKIIPGDSTTYAFRTGHFATGILLIALLVVSIFIEISSAITWLRDHRKDGMASITFLCSAACLWYMGFSGYMQPFVESTAFLAMAEYIGIYLIPVALSFFIQNHTTSPGLHKFCMILTAFLIGFFVYVTLVTIFVPYYSYVDYIQILRILFLFTLLILLVMEFRERHAVRDIGEQTLHYGLAIAISIGVVEMVRFVLAEQFSEQLSWLSSSLMPLCVLVLALTALMYYGVRLTTSQYQKIEQENLKQLAYVDQLTGAPNRAACYTKLDAIKDNRVCDYVVAFIDINFLKKTNDTWGHEKGDELIRTASRLLQEHFTGNDFFGRWGGDEFIAVHFGTLEETREMMEDIQKEIDALNASARFEFTLSEAWGFCESTKNEPLPPEEAIKRADDEMYTAKQKAHAAREQCETA